MSESDWDPIENIVIETTDQDTISKIEKLENRIKELEIQCKKGIFLKTHLDRCRPSLENTFLLPNIFENSTLTISSLSIGGVCEMFKLNNFTNHKIESKNFCIKSCISSNTIKLTIKPRVNESDYFINIRPIHLL